MARPIVALVFLFGRLFGCDGPGPTADLDAGAGGSTEGGARCEGSTVSGVIDTDTTWDCPTYVLDGRVFVTEGATLTIHAGTTILGRPGVEGGSALIVTRGARLMAIGTARQPIVFTSGNPEGERVTGDWAGVALLGAARTNDGACIDDGDPETPACDAPGFLEDRLEGIDVGDDRGRYGGTDDGSDCGWLEYVRIEFAGAELSPDNELNGLTVAGCGRNTTLSHLQIHRGKDDGIEFFGGTTWVDHLLITGPSDDGLDCDEGWRGNGQFIVVHQFPGVGDNAIECDNLGSDEDSEPRTSPTLSNLTLVGAGEGRVAVLREGARATIRNALVVGFGAPPDLRAADIDLGSEWPDAVSWHHSYFFDVGPWPAEAGEDDDDGGYDEQAAFEDPSSENVFDTDPQLGDLDPSQPDYLPEARLMGGTPPRGDTGATWAGAFDPDQAPWTAGWTAFPAD